MTKVLSAGPDSGVGALAGLDMTGASYFAHQLIAGSSGITMTYSASRLTSTVSPLLIVRSRSGSIRIIKQVWHTILV